MAKTIPVRWYSAIVVACCAAALALAQTKTVRPTPDLAGLVRAWRQSPSAANRAAVEAYAAAHANQDGGALALLALGIGEYEQKDYASAIEALQKAQSKLPRLADYTGYYLEAARVEAKQAGADAAAVLAPAHGGDVRSPLNGKAWIVEARATVDANPAGAVQLLRGHYAELPQPEGDVTLADSYQAANDLPSAADFYQRVYYGYLTGEPATRAAAGIAALKDVMKDAYPAPLPQQLLQRADRLLDAKEYKKAKAEYEARLDQMVGVERDQARVRIGAADLLQGNPSAAVAYLRGLELAESEADAERLYYIVECARRLDNENAIKNTVERLSKQYPQSQWRLKTLTNVASRWAASNRPDDFVPLYKAAYEDFPNEPAAGSWHWKVAFQAYFHDRPDAAALLREQLQRYPGQFNAGAALYFLGRLAEQNNDPASAKAYYQRLSQALQNQYYALLARGRLQSPQVMAAVVSTDAERFAADLKLAQSKDVATQDTAATAVRIERSRLLRSAGLNDYADAELRFGARTDGQAVRLGMELASAAEEPHLAVRIMKTFAPDYLGLTLTQAPRKFWELLFPLPYRSDLETSARRNGVDPFVLAGLIRQESEFNPRAVSRANAFGLTQVRPGTGREFARQNGIAKFSDGLLFQPAINLKLGSSIFRSMLDRNGGSVEQTLAAYNAGPARAAQWISWNTYREPAEFIESIPYTETRDYVQAVLRNADIYRRLYE